MHLIITQTPHTDTRAAEAILEALGMTRAPETADTETTHRLILHSRPETAIARAIADGQTGLEEAVEAWTESARALLETARHHRSRTTLLDADAATTDPATFRAVCAERFERGEKNKDTTEPPDTENEPSAIHRVIAAQAVAQSNALQELAGELEARSIPVGDTATAPIADCAAALEQTRETASAKEATTEENELLLLQLHQVQEELETYYLESQEKEEQRRKLAEENDKLTKRRDELKRENRRQRDRIERLERNLADIKRSASWKLTVPLRAVRGPKKTRAQPR